MDRWMRWKTVFQDSVNSPDDPGSGEETEGEPQNQDPSSEQPPTGIETGFTNERLKGMSPSEIENLLLMQEETIREQGRELNKAAKPQNQPPPKPEPEPEPEVDATEFWNDPAKYLKEDRNRTVKAVRDQLEEIISPFRENLIETQEQKVWNQFLNKHTDGAKFRGLIEEGLRQSNIDDPNLGTIETIYYSIKGRLADAGKTIDEVTGESSGGKTRKTQNDPPMNPQHRPSSHPTRTETRSDEPSRELTENEKKMARDKWPNLPAKKAYSRFIQWQELDEGDVIGSSIGREGK